MQIDTKRIIINGIRSFISKTSLVISLNPHVAGKILPTLSSVLGSIFTGNIMPVSIIEGKNINCDAIVSFDMFLISSPSTVPTAKLLRNTITV